MTFIADRRPEMTQEMRAVKDLMPVVAMGQSEITAACEHFIQGKTPEHAAVLLTSLDQMIGNLTDARNRIAPFVQK